MLHKRVGGRPLPGLRCAHPFRNICKGLKREVNGELPNPMTWIGSYHSVIDHCWVGSHPKKSIEKGQAYIFYEMKCGLIYALHRVRVCLLSGAGTLIIDLYLSSLSLMTSVLYDISHWNQRLQSGHFLILHSSYWLLKTMLPELDWNSLLPYNLFQSMLDSISTMQARCLRWLHISFNPKPGISMKKFTVQFRSW